MNLLDYKNKVALDHKSKPVRKWYGLYAWFWFHTQFWLEPIERRPYFRDWIYPHMAWFLFILAVWYAGMFIWSYWNHWIPSVLFILSSWLSAHLIWGSKWIPEQQEDPQILDC
jgi:protein-S-isoprenylcysteine O-methyltransferase Ste14